MLFVMYLMSAVYLFTFNFLLYSCWIFVFCCCGSSCFYECLFCLFLACMSYDPIWYSIKVVCRLRCTVKVWSHHWVSFSPENVDFYKLDGISNWRSLRFWWSWYYEIETEVFEWAGILAAFEPKYELMAWNVHAQLNSSFMFIETIHSHWD